MFYLCPIVSRHLAAAQFHPTMATCPIPTDLRLDRAHRLSPVIVDRLTTMIVAAHRVWKVVGPQAAGMPPCTEGGAR